MKKIALILGIVCLLLTMAICIQIKTVDTITENEGISLNDNTELQSEVLRRRQMNKDAYKQLEEAEERLEKVRTEASKNNGLGDEIENQIKRDRMLLGLTEVKGAGVIIKVDDNREINENEVIDVASYLVHEEDLMQIVNELFNAGADAISINGQRIVSTTSIVCDGNVIRVNDAIISVPIEIKAIGYPSTLRYALTRPMGYLRIMQSGGVVVDIEEKEDITIPKYEGVYTHEYILNES